MRIIFSMFLSFLVVATGVWAYWQNHKTSRAKAYLAQLEGELATIKQDIVVYEIEWSNLNRPERLRSLVEQHYDTLNLVEISARSYAFVDALAPLERRIAPIVIDEAVMVEMPQTGTGETQ